MIDRGIITMEQALINVFRNKPNKDFTMEDIRFEFQKYYKLSDYQKEINHRYPQTRWHHEIRSIINKLVKRGIVEKIKRNCYKYGET